MHSQGLGSMVTFAHGDSPSHSPKLRSEQRQLQHSLWPSFFDDIWWGRSAFDRPLDSVLPLGLLAAQNLCAAQGAVETRDTRHCVRSARTTIHHEHSRTVVTGAHSFLSRNLVPRQFALLLFRLLRLLSSCLSFEESRTHTRVPGVLCLVILTAQQLDCSCRNRLDLL